LPAIQKVENSLKPTDPDFWSREEKSTVSLYEKCFLEKGYLYRVKDGKELLCVPNIRRQDEDVRYQVFEQFHDEPMSGHRGVIQIAAAMRRRVYWKICETILKNIYGRVPRVQCIKSRGVRLRENVLRCRFFDRWLRATTLTFGQIALRN
jgi:hypothetical protein